MATIPGADLDVNSLIPPEVNKKIYCKLLMCEIRCIKGILVCRIWSLNAKSGARIQLQIGYCQVQSQKATRARADKE